MSPLNLKTHLCDMLGIEYPIILAGMADASGPKLAAAVSNAGGLGMLGATFLRPKHIREWIRRTKDLTDKPFGVNCVFPSGIPEQGEKNDLSRRIPEEHREFVRSLQRELGLSEPKKLKWEWELSETYTMKQFEVILEEGVPVFSSGLGTPEWVVKECHARGMKVISLVGTVKAARTVASRGVDVIIAQGYEAGGHTGRIGTMALVPQVVDAVRPIPVVAAGGIADGRGLVAALALGAVGVCVGTAFLATPEAGAEFIEVGYTNEEGLRAWKEAALRATEADTLITRVISGKPARYIKNRLIELWEEKGPRPLPMPYQSILMSPLLSSLRENNKREFLSGYAGQIVGILKEIKPAASLVREITEQAAALLNGAGT